MPVDRGKRQVFDSMMSYDAVRPDYPKLIIDRIVDFADLPSDAKVFEIGCGPGKATLAFAQRGYKITALDISENLLNLAKQKTAQYPQVSCLLGPFETAVLPEDHFDLVISASAFHWIDPDIGYAKAAKLLKRSGSMALFWNHHNYERRDFIPGILDFFKKYSSHFDPCNSSSGTLTNEIKDKLSSSALFGPVHQFSNYRELEYTKEDYLKLVDTFSWVNILDEKIKSDFFDDLKSLLETQAEPLMIPFTTVLLICKKK